MNKSNKTWLTSETEILQCLLVDEAKNKAMIDSLQKTISQLQAKSAFRLALINSLREAQSKEQINKD